MNEKLKQVLRRLKLTRRSETVCLMEWECRLILEYIAELERREKKDGSAEV